LIKQLRTSLTKTDEANNAKSVFLASASHDLRQPLHALALMTEILGNTQLNQRQADLQQRMLSAVDSTRSMLDSLLDISKLEAGAISAEEKPFSTNLKQKCNSSPMKKTLAIARAQPRR